MGSISISISPLNMPCKDKPFSPNIQKAQKVCLLCFNLITLPYTER